MVDEFIPQVTPTPTPAPTPKPLIDAISGIFFDYIIPIIILVVVLIIIAFIVKKLLKNKLVKRKEGLLFKDFNIGKYTVKLFRFIGGKYVEVDTVKMDISKDTGFKYRNKDFRTFDASKISFSDSRSNYYAFDLDTGSQLIMNKRSMPERISVDDVDTYVNRGIIEQIVKGLEDIKPKGQWLMLICGLALGLGIGIVIGIYVM